MTTITEDYCSYEVAKLLKEKGFDEEVLAVYIYDKLFVKGENEIVNAANVSIIPAPTHQMAMKWLREVYGLHISLEPCYDYDSMHVVFLAFVQNVADVHEFFDGRKNVASYPNAEKSYELAIKYCLENLI